MDKSTYKYFAKYVVVNTIIKFKKISLDFPCVCTLTQFYISLNISVSKDYYLLYLMIFYCYLSIYILITELCYIKQNHQIKIVISISFIIIQVTNANTNGVAYSTYIKLYNLPLLNRQSYSATARHYKPNNYTAPTKLDFCQSPSGKLHC